MVRPNKKDSIIALHKENILKAAEKLFSEKGFSSTKIDDISKLSEYSRRTIYTYYDSKEDILYHIILKGLIALEKDLFQAIESDAHFLEKYTAICTAMANYYTSSPHSFDAVENMQTKNIDYNHIPKVVTEIFAVGTSINNMLANYIESGQRQGVIRQEIKAMPTVYILWTSISSLLKLARNKGFFLEMEFKMKVDEFLEYGFKQIINSILEERI